MVYSLGFAKQLIESARLLKGSGDLIEERKRALLYLSLLSLEISLKYLLEKTGVPIARIRRRSHNIEALLEDLGHCEILVSSMNQQQYVSATRIRAQVVNPMFGGTTIGNLLAGESKGASRYPNEVRYVPMPQHYPPDLMLECAETVINWAEKEGTTIRVRTDA